MDQATSVHQSLLCNSENAVRIQVYCAICTHCLVAIVEHECHLNGSLFDVLRVSRGSLIDKTPIRELFDKPIDDGPEICENVGFHLNSNFCYILLTFYK